MPCPPSIPASHHAPSSSSSLVPAGPRALTQELHGEVAGLGQQAPADDGLLGGVQGVPHDQRDACGGQAGRAARGPGQGSPRAGTRHAEGRDGAPRGPRFPPAPRGAAAGRGSGPFTAPRTSCCRLSHLLSRSHGTAAPPRAPLCWGTWSEPSGIQSMHSPSYPTCSTPESPLGKLYKIPLSNLFAKSTCSAPQLQVSDSVPAVVSVPVPSLCGQQRAPVHGTALTEEGSSIEPDGGLAARRLLLKDGIKELVRESEGLAGRERHSAT